MNRDGAVNVGEAARDANSKLLFLSSDYVFDGKNTSPYETEDARNPQSVYGHSKAEAEDRLQGILPGCCIVRTSWLFGTEGKCFPDTILRLASSRPLIEVVNDQRGSPTYATDLARAIRALCRSDASGIVHVTNEGDCTWFEFAQEIVKRSGLATEVKPVTSAANGTPRTATGVLRSLRKEPAKVWHRDTPLARSAGQIFKGAEQLSESHCFARCRLLGCRGVQVK